jgi:hypothetical protein
MLTADDEDEAGQSLLAELGSAEAAAAEVGVGWVVTGRVAMGSQTRVACAVR